MSEWLLCVTLRLLLVELLVVHHVCGPSHSLPTASLTGLAGEVQHVWNDIGRVSGLGRGSGCDGDSSGPSGATGAAAHLGRTKQGSVDNKLDAQQHRCVTAVVKSEDDEAATSGSGGETDLM